MTNSITLTNTSLTTSTAVRLLAGEFTYSWQNLISANPSNSSFGSVEPVFNGWENPIGNLTFVIPTDSNPSGCMTWALWNQFAKAPAGYPTTDTIMSLTYGDSDTLFADYSQSSSTTAVTSIPIMIKGYSLRFSPADSRNSAHWTINAQIIITN